MGPQAKSLPLLAAIALMSQAGCLTDLSPVYIETFLSPSLTANTCDPGEEISAGVLDTSRGAGYVVGVRVVNDLPDNAKADEGQINSNRLTLESAILDYRFSDGKGKPPKPITVPLNGTISAAGNTSLLVSLLNDEGIKALRHEEGTLLVSVAVKGRLASGGSIQSSALELPIELCTKCVIKPECEIETEKNSGPAELKPNYIRTVCSPKSFGQPGGYMCTKVDEEPE